ncbi:amino acid ABC transporter permease [Rhizobium sp. CFBP 8762]|uniref:amino acid ABC transporter permease n=1 Tax=Rhizobium sp. CFBP 8762 TaxID=2775279 RepID=UPI00177A7FDF|nr:amino acid ABC transporter permease [Rhizobium sp. CFBP 8762]MBD8555709.1 amino acid ABC transporter permease [Rhizobium sp. CFBP 8762]
MAMDALNPPRKSGRTGSFFNDPKVRGVMYQAIALFLIALCLYWIISNTVENLHRSNIASGYGFLNGRAGFDVGQSLIAFTSDSKYGRAFIVGLTNTILVAVTGIITATIIGFIVGIGRLSNNWLIAKLSLAYVEFFRNIPPLLVIFFWYYAILSLLPLPRESINLPLDTYLNNQGLLFPKPLAGDGFGLTLIACLVAFALVIGLVLWSKKRQAATGRSLPVLAISIAILIALPALTLILSGMPLTFEVPVAGRFGIRGGSTIGSEFISLFLALSFYTAAFIAEIVRSGIRGVSKGQTEAAHALGIRPRQTTRLVVVPQAMRIIIPPLTSQYLNLMKNSSLAVAVGYADLVAIGGTILNQTGQAIEVVSIWIIVYLSLSLITAAIMNWFNARVSLVER